MPKFHCQYELTFEVKRITCNMFKLVVVFFLFYFRIMFDTISAKQAQKSKQIRFSGYNSFTHAQM